MKIVKVTYQCDYCKKMIDPVIDEVCAIQPGRIGYQDSFIADPDDRIHHYHDYCLEGLLLMRFQEDDSERTVEKEPDAPEMSFAEMLDEEPEHAPTKKKENKKDLGKLQSLLNAGWSQKKIADEFGVHLSTIYKWMKELEGRVVNEC